MLSQRTMLRLLTRLRGGPRGAEMLQVPKGRVRLANGRKRRVPAFQLDVRPVTNEDWEQFVEATGARRPHWMYKPGFGELSQPVVGITYSEAAAYAHWVGKRLPTELEWLRAARGNDARPYPWGEAYPSPGLTHFGLHKNGAPSHVTQSLRSKGAGPWGHHDLAGNVWEWCRGAILKGGFWGSQDPNIDTRRKEDSNCISGGIGFRCAL
jgi:formylglycine-generating enzyme required for sulfatase activity